MLEGLRVASQNWIGRALMGLVMGFIVISFAIWGIGDVFRGFTSQRLARVGSGEVTVDAFRSAYQNEIRHMQQRARRAITNEEARRLGLDQQVLERLVVDAALDQKTHSLGMAISEGEVANLLKSENVFKGPTGQFDPERFKQVIRDAGFSERSFLIDQKGAYLRRELIDSVVAGIDAPPRIMEEAFHRFRSEARSVDYFILPASSVGEIKAPSEEDLKKYYSDHEQTFRAKEFRKLTTLAATPQTLAKPGEVSDEDLRKLYEEVKTKRYGTPEKRDVRQIVFKTEKEAADAYDRLKNGLSFDALASERNLSARDIDLGAVELRDFGDQKLGAAVFKLEKPGVVEPVTTPFGVVVSEVRKITPSVFTKSYEQAAPELRREIAVNRAAPEVRRLHDAIEEQRTAGKTLAEAAKAVGLDVKLIDAADATGHDKSGAEISSLVGEPDLLKAIFASDVGVDNDTVTTKDSGYVWFEIAAVEQARQQTFEEVKGAVESSLRSEQLQKALTAKADEMSEKLRQGKSIDDYGKELGVEIKRATEVKRAPRPEFTTKAIVQMFSTPVHGSGSVEVDGGRLVFYVKESATPPFDPSALESKSTAEQLKSALSNDILEQYVGGLEKALGVDINQRALQAATGAGAEQEQ
jgi:peptidyl-prolyl cis-trans isomerase D